MVEDKWDDNPGVEVRFGRLMGDKVEEGMVTMGFLIIDMGRILQI